jgi:hypothetical protein
MRSAGPRAFAARTDAKSATCSFEESGVVELADDDARQFRANQAAWYFFQAQSASCRKAAI